MSLTDSAARLSRSAAADTAPWIVRLARAGYAAKGAVYMLVGGLAVAAAVGARGETESKRGALATVLGAPFGRAILAIAAVGLMGYVVWQGVRAVLDPEGRGSDARGLAVRAGNALSGAIYGSLAFEALRLSRGASGSADQNSTAHWTSAALGLPFGRLLVGLVGLGVAGYGVYQAVRAVRSDVGRRLDLSRLTAGQRENVEWIGRAGLGARAVVFVLTGLFLGVAAWRERAADARGLDGVLRTLEQQAFGPALLAAVGLGLVAYGLFQIIEARYRTIRPA